MFNGWSLLLCHGNIHYVPNDLFHDKMITTDISTKSKPDIVLDIYQTKCDNCPLFDRILCFVR